MKKNKDHLDELVTATAQKELAKTGMLQMRIEPILLERIYAAANEKGVRYTTLVRDWIIDKLDQQGQDKSQSSSESTTHLIQVINQLNQRMSMLEGQLALLSPTGMVKTPGATYNVGSRHLTQPFSEQHADIDLSCLRPGESITVEIPKNSQLVREGDRLILKRPKLKAKTTRKANRKAK